MIARFVTLSAFVAICLGSNRVSYNGHQVWRLSPKSDTLSGPVHELLNKYAMDTWSVTKDYVDFRVPKQLVNSLRADLVKENISFDVIIEDLGSLVTLSETSKSPLKLRTSAEFIFDQYHSLDEIMLYLDQLEAESSLVTSEEIGRTVEDREIRLIKVSSPNGPIVKPAVWIDCGIHAREWISPATCLWGLNYITTQYGIDPDTTDFIDQHDLYLLPVLNPDGYDYTWTTDRLWRKNRVQHTNLCFGTDLNRNYDDGHWGGVGASNNACVDTYHGPTPFSELETSAVRAKILELLEVTPVKAFFSVHSYGQLWLFAYGWTGDLPPEADELFRVSQVGVDAIASVYGTAYVNGPHYTTIYPASGTAVDWGYSVGIVNTFIVELRDTGTFGFLLPEDQILPTARETWTGLLASINAI